MEKAVRKFNKEQITSVYQDETRTMFSIVFKKGMNEWTEGERSACNPFLNKFYEIRVFCESKLFDMGEALVLLNKATGYQWRTIPYNRIDDCFEYIKNNWFNFRLLIHPESHWFAMDSKNNVPGCKEYRDWYNSRGTK